MENLAHLRDFSFLSVALRLLLAMILGGLLGLERVHKRRPAGFRTYILVCIGATLAMLLGQYLVHVNDRTQMVAVGTIMPDVSRMGAQVINGIGFLGAATVIITGKQQVKGLTTATGLWTVACMGLAIGAGFYECVIPAFLVIFLSTSWLQRFDNFLIERSKNMNVYLEFRSLENIGQIIDVIKTTEANIYEIDIGHGQENRFVNPCATFALRLKKSKNRAELLLKLSLQDYVCSIDEI